MEISFSNLTLIDNKNSSREVKYLDNVNLDIHSGEIVGFLGDYLDVIGKLLLIIKMIYLLRDLVILIISMR